MNKDISKPFWKNKKLTDLNNDEWESLCDGCARCCLLKLEDTNTNEIASLRLGKNKNCLLILGFFVNRRNTSFTKFQ